MIYYFIADSDRTDDVTDKSFDKKDELQQRVDTLNFEIFQGVRPSENEEVLLFDGTEIISLSGTTLVLAQGFPNFDKFRPNDEIWLGLGESTEEKVIVSSISSDGKTITLTANAVSAHSLDEKMGKKIFGGTIQRVRDANLHLLSNLVQRIECADFTKIFDKKLINDSWKDRSSKYIIIDFVNTTINFNNLIDDFEYENVTALRAEWIESGDGDNPTLSDSDFKEGDKSAGFPWTNSGGTATFTASPSARNVSELTGVVSGAPTKGIIAFWYKQADNATVTDIKVRIGSDSSNYTEVTLSPSSDNDWNYARLDLTDGTTTGSPDWTLMDYTAIIVAQTGNSSIQIDGLRINATNSFTFDNVLEGATFDDFRSPFKKPTGIMGKLADQNSFNWYIDYDRDIHFFSTETNAAPFNLNETSNNFNQLRILSDAAKIANRQVVQGGNETASIITQQDIPGDGVRREWFIRNKFRNLSMQVDTGSGFTTESVLPDFINDPGTARYFSNFNAQSIRADASTSTLITTSTLRLRYNEVIPIVTIAKDNASITSFKTLLGNDGIFDGKTIIDKTIKTRVEAEARARVETDKYSNPIITATFKTNFEGLRSGQLITIQDSTEGRNIDQNFLIQSVSVGQISSEDGLNIFTVKCASTFFGIMEFLQKLIRDANNLEVDEDETIFNVETWNEEVNATESWVRETGQTVVETVSMTESFTSSVLTPPFLWGSTTSANELKWNLGTWATGS